MMKTRREAFTPCELRLREKDGATGREIEGYAIVFDTPSEPLWEDDQYEIREVISREAITKELLDGCDIKMTMFHNRQLILARSRQGSGTLSYEVDGKGVKFTFEAPNTVDGDKAVELVKRGDIAGCSFAFVTNYSDRNCVERKSETRDGKEYITYTVKQVESVHDFTLAADPAYSETSVSAREMGERLHRSLEPESNEPQKVSGAVADKAQETEVAESDKAQAVAAQVREMKERIKRNINR